MGLLQLDADLDIRKIILSFWFRIPSATVALVKTPGKAIFAGYNMENFVPLICMGPQQNVVINEIFADYVPTTNNLTTPCTPGAGPGGELEGQYYTGSSTSIPHGPTYIGCYFSETGFYPDGTMLCNIQTTNTAALSGVYAEIHSWNCVLGEWVPETDDGSSFVQAVDAFGLSSGAIKALPDRWHHMLISWDVTNGCSSHGEGGSSTLVDSVSKMWHAFDNVNYSSGNLLAQWANNVSGTQSWGTNDIISNLVSQQTGVSDKGFGLPTASLAVSSIPSNPICIPGALAVQIGDGTSNETTGVNFETKDVGQLVEMAELQMWIGQTCDTSLIGVRSLFVTSDGKPEPMSTAQEVFGTPVIALSGKANWEAGTNTGSSGNFTKTGTISDFTPGPSLP